MLKSKLSDDAGSGGGAGPESMEGAQKSHRRLAGSLGGALVGTLRLGWPFRGGGAAWAIPRWTGAGKLPNACGHEKTSAPGNGHVGKPSRARA